MGEPGSAGGAMLENFAVMERARQLTWSGERGRFYHFRTKIRLKSMPSSTPWVKDVIRTAMDGLVQHRINP